MAKGVNFTVDRAWEEQFAPFYDALLALVQRELGAGGSAAGAGASDDTAHALGVQPADLSTFRNGVFERQDGKQNTKSSTIAAHLVEALAGAKPSTSLGFESTADIDLFWANTAAQRRWLEADAEHGLRAQSQRAFTAPDLGDPPAPPERAVPAAAPPRDADHAAPEAADPLLAPPLHHHPSELADFRSRGIPATNRDEEGSAPLLMRFSFNEVPVRLAGEDTEFQLRVNSAKLQLRLTTPALEAERDRTEEALDGSKLRLKLLPRSLNELACGWLIEHPAHSKQLAGTFDWIHLCYLSNADQARGVADMTVTSGQIAVYQGGKRIGGGRESMAAKVVAQWAVWAGLGQPDGEEPVYHLGREPIEAGDDE